MADLQLVIDQAREHRRSGRTQRALELYEEAAQAAETPEQLAHVLRHVGELAAEQGQAERAVSAADHAIQIYRSSVGASPLDLANAIRVRALALDCGGRREEAIAAWTEARGVYGELGVEAGVAECNARLKG